MTAGLSCLLLGEEPLLQRCGDVLRARGHHIVAVVTRAPALETWCAEHGLRRIDRDEYQRVLEEEVVDVLFSITYPAIIPSAAFRRARVAALNFHDGPLPRYAGMNGSAWAILEGERKHAVVWHHITEGIDEGHIVARRDVELDVRETSVSLNMKNAALALDAFREVLTRLEQGHARGTPQDSSCERRLFSRHDRPEALATLDFTRPAAAVDQCVRACDFGAYANRFGLAKVVHRGRAVVVREALPSSHSALPGAVIAVEDDHWLVGAGAGAVRLSRFASLGGAPLSAPEAAAALALAPGQTLVDGGREERAALTRKVAEAEPFYLRALRDRIPPSIGFSAGAPEDDGSLALSGMKALAARFSGRSTDALIAIFALGLSSLCRQDTFDVAVVDAGARAELGDAPSLFFPAVPLRLAVDGEAPFADFSSLLEKARASLAERGPFLVDLVARHPELAAQPDLARGELSTVAIVIGEAEPPPGASLTLTISGDSAVLSSRGRVPAKARTALAEAMDCMARRVGADPSAALRTIDMIDDASKRRQLVEWNATAAPFSEQLCIHELFERQVNERPDAVALVCRGETMTFAEVEHAANRVAHALAEHGVKPGVFVGLALPRGFGLVIAMLGIAKSGGAYVPIDGSYPIERASFMLEDARCAVLLTTPERAADFPRARTLFLDGPEIAGASSSRPRCTATSRDVCYAIYTSGTTGRPKGVVLTHRAVVNTLEWVNRAFAVGPSDRSLFVTSPGFDLSVYDVFGALGAGASLDIATEATLGDPSELARILCDGDITIWNSAPPALQLVVPSLPKKAHRARLRLVMLSGDWIPLWMPDRLRAVFGPLNVESLGGATEAAIWSNHHSVGEVDPAWPSIPYGRPIQNARYYILDRQRRPLPVGLSGDLYIAGVCLAEGYLNRTELTAERFVADPFVPGERMYLTGDLARFFPDGTIELLGRADFQIKVRGFRVELAEIEHAIRSLPSVEDVVCTTIRDGSGQTSVVAYVVGRRGRHPSGSEIRESLAASLPEFMIPAHVVALSTLPVSSNGKVDRKSLPPPGEHAQASTAFVAPRAPMEQKIAAIWEELLQRKPIGVDDDFFALGGHSLMAVMLISRLKNELGIELPLSRVLEKPTIAGLAASMGDLSRVEHSSRHLLALHAGGSRPALVLVAGVGGYGFTYRNFPSLLGKDQPVYALQAIGAEDESELVDLSIEDMASVYERELLRACPKGPVVLGGFSFGVLPAFELARRLQQRGRAVPLLVSFDGFAPGYPDLLPFRDRARSHLLAFLLGQGEGRRAYVRERAKNVRRRLLTWLGRDAEAELAPPLPFADPALQDRLRKIWAMHVRARGRYRPRACLPCDLLLVKAGTPEQWIGTQMDDPLYGWRRFVSGRISTMTVPGQHTRIFATDSQPFIAETLRQHIDGSIEAAASGEYPVSARRASVA